MSDKKFENLKDIKEIDKNMKELETNVDDTVQWNDISEDVINEYMLGKGLKNGAFNRLNDTFVSDNVQTLKLHPAGYSIEFKTNSSFIKLRAKLAGAAYMSHMTAVGTIGFSIYVLKDGKWYFLNCTKINKPEYELNLLGDLNNEEYTYRLYFPLYQALISVSVGTEKGKKFEFVKDEMDSLLIYGTSISQGGCATRPGMDYGAILGRMANLNVINLGFSGSCKVEREMLDIINEMIKVRNIKYIVFELESNSPSYDHFKERFSYYMEHLYNKENIKLYLISHFDEAMPFVNEKLNKYRKGFFKVQKETAKKYGVTFINGNKLIKSLECDGSVDGAHLSDLGFYEVAKQLNKIIAKDK